MNIKNIAHLGINIIRLSCRAGEAGGLRSWGWRAGGTGELEMESWGDWRAG